MPIHQNDQDLIISLVHTQNSNGKLKYGVSILVHDFSATDGSAPIRVALPSGVRVHISPGSEYEKSYLTTRPYHYDKQPDSDVLWRSDHTMKQRKLLRAIEQADRGIRHQAYLVMMAFARLEPTLHALTVDQVRDEPCKGDLYETEIGHKRTILVPSSSNEIEMKDN